MYPYNVCTYVCGYGGVCVHCVTVCLWVPLSILVCERLFCVRVATSTSLDLDVVSVRDVGIGTTHRWGCGLV